MSKRVGWMVPVAAAVAMVVGMAGVSAARAAEDAAKEKGSVSGTVVDKDGKGVAGVTVHLLKPGMRRGPGGPGGEGGGGQRPPREPQAQRGHGHEEAKPLQEGGRPERPGPVATAKTDDAGKFEMKDVPAGEYMVGVRDEEKKVYGMSRVTVKAGEAATVEIKTSDQPMRRGPGGPGGGEGGRRRGPGGEGGGGGGQQPQ